MNFELIQGTVLATILVPFHITSDFDLSYTPLKNTTVLTKRSYPVPAFLQYAISLYCWRTLLVDWNWLGEEVHWWSRSLFRPHFPVTLAAVLKPITLNVSLRFSSILKLPPPHPATNTEVVPEVLDYWEHVYQHSSLKKWYSYDVTNSLN
jgi:hypothetical protein